MLYFVLVALLLVLATLVLFAAASLALGQYFGAYITTPGDTTPVISSPAYDARDRED